MLLLHGPMYMYAQATDKKQGEKRRENEAGLKLEFSGEFGGQTDFTGLQFKHFGKLNIGYRLFAGYGNVLSSEYDRPPLVNSDSLIKRTALNVYMPIAGLGIEGQHPLYKHAYMFAVIEARAGYGGHSMDTISYIRSYKPGLPSRNGIVEHRTRTSGQRVNMTYIGLAAAVGIKAQLKRITAGVEFPFLISSTYVHGDEYSPDRTIMITIGFFAHYRF